MVSCFWNVRLMRAEAVSIHLCVPEFLEQCLTHSTSFDSDLFEVQMNDINKEIAPRREMGIICEEATHRRKNKCMKRCPVSPMSRKIQIKQGILFYSSDCQREKKIKRSIISSVGKDAGR